MCAHQHSYTMSEIPHRKGKKKKKKTRNDAKCSAKSGHSLAIHLSFIRFDKHLRRNFWHSRFPIFLTHINVFCLSFGLMFSVPLRCVVFFLF